MGPRKWNRAKTCVQGGWHIKENPDVKKDLEIKSIREALPQIIMMNETKYNFVEESEYYKYETTIINNQFHLIIKIEKIK